MLTLLLVVSVVAASLRVITCFLLYVRLMRFVVTETGSTEGLKDVAVAMRAFRALPWPRSRSD